MMIKVGIDMDCLINNRGLSKFCLDFISPKVKVFLTTDSAENLNSRLSELFYLFPQLKRINLFTNKEDCNFHINNVKIPADWITYRVEIIKLLKEV